MAYLCPRCGKPVQRGHSATAQYAAGLVGALFSMAFGAFTCPTCGKIARREFPPEVRSKMALGSTVMVVIAVAIAIACIVLIVSINH